SRASRGRRARRRVGLHPTQRPGEGRVGDVLDRPGPRVIGPAGQPPPAGGGRPPLMPSGPGELPRGRPPERPPGGRGLPGETPRPGAPPPPRPLPGRTSPGSTE